MAKAKSKEKSGVIDSIIPQLHNYSIFMAQTFYDSDCFLGNTFGKIFNNN